MVIRSHLLPPRRGVKESRADVTLGVLQNNHLGCPADVVLRDKQHGVHVEFVMQDNHV